jgi:hypothetical protein
MKRRHGNFCHSTIDSESFLSFTFYQLPTTSAGGFLVRPRFRRLLLRRLVPSELSDDVLQDATSSTAASISILL